MKQINNLGILAGIMWNSHKWGKSPTKADLENSKFAYVQDNEHGHESINFGQKKYPSEPDGSYIAYTSMFNRFPSAEESKNVKVVFFKSNNWHDGQTYIVGMYAFPEIDEFYREAEHDIYSSYDWGNIKSEVSNVVRFDKYVPISNETLTKDRFLPLNKKLGQQGFNYLHSDNVLKILDRAREINPKQDDLFLVSCRLKKIILF